jgi:hypothetical protein
MYNKTKKNTPCNIDKLTLNNIRNKHSIKSRVFPKNFHNIVYNTPVKDDMAIGLVYFNTVGSKRLLMNYLYTVEKLKLAKIPYYTIEMYVNKKDIADAIHVKTDVILFQKERLCRVLERHIPAKYTKLLFMDTDIVYDNINWYNDISKKLNDHSIVQCYSNIYYTDITYKKIEQVILSSTAKRITNDNSAGIGTPGGSWAFQRTWFNEIGFFEYDPTGGSDTYSVLLWRGEAIDNSAPYLKYALEEYKAKIKELPSICFVEGIIYHLWHGTMKNRQYSLRKQIFTSVKDIRSVVKIGKNGLLELTNGKYKAGLIKYFKNKDDDGVEEQKQAPHSTK